VYPHQAERLTAALEREGLAALVATTPGNLAYVTGFRSLVPAGERL
jgi:Xaa-Pro aminopeptidase